MQQGLGALGAVPVSAFDTGLDCTVHAEPRDLYRNIQRGKIQRRRAEITSMNHGSLHLSDGTTCAADVVILATGFRRTLPFLPPEVVHKIVQPPDMQLKLYHNIYPYALGGSSLFVMGWNVGLLTCLFADLAARWALELVEGRIRKTTEEMCEFHQKLHQWADTYFEPEAALDIKRGCTTAYGYDYVDDMLEALFLWNDYRRRGEKLKLGT
ncbi:hypothetical protein GPECTOR_1g600 [Gonium pectorale]|uniref:Flavin-containing monooxygenase n=1 Tax=Gonium pectorale TaxID=33097 RepID=A0A150H3C2_GONPE|nr:hypothetical protein GPECTOR_1g600 [Gonium pectorale]|eukprot:KXZ56667.1 hypothetical protein GPECTOR_1g600 [Gonium pectorale]